MSVIHVKNTKNIVANLHKVGLLMAYSAELSKEEQKTLAKMKVEKALVKIKRDVASVFTNSQLPKFLSFAVKFHYFDVNNVLLLYKQFPEATFVASFKTWKNLSDEFRGKGNNRPVFATSQKGNGIGILAPYILKKKITDSSKQGRDGSQILVSYLDYHVVFVFDKSQTNNIPSPIIPWDLQGRKEESEFLFRALNVKAPFFICFEDSNSQKNYRYEAANGEKEKDKLIFKATDRESYFDLCNFTVKHYVLNSLAEVKSRYPFNDFQKIAECVAFMISSYFGLPINDYVFFFANEWGYKTAGEMIELLATIHGSAHRMIDELEEEIAYIRVLYGSEDLEDIDSLFDFIGDYDF